MKALKPIVIALVAMVVLLCSCDRDAVRTAFVESSGVHLTVGQQTPFTYNPLTCQLAFNRGSRQFRAHTDNMSDYFVADFSEIPSTVGQTLSADLTWTTESNVLTRDGITLEVVKLEGDMVWLWSETSRIGLVIRILQ